MSVLVDDDDYNNLIRWKWAALLCDNRRRWYAIRTDGTGILMHRYLLGITDPAIEVDHRNGNGLDNQRSNIRKCTHTQNMQNRPGWSKRSKFKGVQPAVSPGRWIMQIRVNGRKITSRHGYEEEAARRYDELAQLYFGEFARLNFPKEAAA